MSSFEEVLGEKAPAWPYPIEYDKEAHVETDVLVLGGGVSGCFAAIAAAKKGATVSIVDKSAIKRAGGAGSGIDHWHNAATNPASRVTPEMVTESLLRIHNQWTCRMTTYIQCRESYDCLLDLEKMGMKIRDSEDEFKGADFRDEKSKLLFCYDYKNKFNVRVWGTGMKPALYKECRRLGISLYERVMMTSLLTEGGRQGSRVVGATGVNVRTGKFMVFTAKATVLALSQPFRLWIFTTEHTGFGGATLEPPINTGDGHAIAWKAGAEFTQMEKSQAGGWGGMAGWGVQPYMTGTHMATWFPCSIVDSKGKEVPWVNAKGEPVPPEKRAHPVNVPGQKLFLSGGGQRGSGVSPAELLPPHIIMAKEGMMDFTPPGFVPPFYADLPSMSKHERRAIFGLMVGQEGLTEVGYRNLTQGGFDPDKDMLQVYPKGSLPPGWRWWWSPSGGMVPDWDLSSTLEGLYGTGRTLFGGGDCSLAAATGKYAGRKAADFALKARKLRITQRQVAEEKARVYRPVKRTNGINWKELNAGICQVMQNYCGDVKTEELLTAGLAWFKELKEGEALEAYARNPHELMRTLECFNIITCGEIVMHASLARKASNVWLAFERLDYPQKDQAEWDKWITIKLENDSLKIGELPLDYGGSLRENYEAHCGL